MFAKKGKLGQVPKPAQTVDTPKDCHPGSLPHRPLRPWPSARSAGAPCTWTAAPPWTARTWVSWRTEAWRRRPRRWWRTRTPPRQRRRCPPCCRRDRRRARRPEGPADRPRGGRWTTGDPLRKPLWFSKVYQTNFGLIIIRELSFQLPGQLVSLSRIRAPGSGSQSGSLYQNQIRFLFCQGIFTCQLFVFLPCWLDLCACAVTHSAGESARKI